MSDTIRQLRELLRVLDTPRVLCVCDLGEKPCPRCLRLIDAMTKICQHAPALLAIAEAAERAHGCGELDCELCAALAGLREVKG